MTPQELLLAAAEDQETYGHHKGSLFPLGSYADGKVSASPACALGSLTRANGFQTYNDPHARDAYKGAVQLLREAIGLDENGRVPGWNDRPEVTGADVAAMMRKAAGYVDPDAVWDEIMRDALAEGLAVPYGV